MHSNSTGNNSDGHSSNGTPSQVQAPNQASITSASTSAGPHSDPTATVVAGSSSGRQVGHSGMSYGAVPQLPSSRPPLSEEKRFKYVNDCAINVGNTPSGTATLLIYIKGTPFFGIGSMYNLTAVELTDASMYYNSKKDFLLDEDIDPNSQSPENIDKDRRMHKLHLYKLSDTGEYRIDLSRFAKTGIPEIDSLDPWKDSSDMDDQSAGSKQLEVVKNFANVLEASRNEPDIVITAKIPKGSPELEQCVGIVMFQRVQ